MRKNLSKKLKKIPQKSGVYIFKDNIGRILYIGKAVNLKNRVRSHFELRVPASKDEHLQLPYPTGAEWRDKIADLDWIETDDEKQALLLENELIKKYQPCYNIQWRDDKSYFRVIFSDDEWPRVKIVHQRQALSAERQAQIIGPFVNGRELKNLLRALRKILPFRTCKNPYNKPCLQWHLGLCPAHNPNCHSGESRNPESGSRIKCGMTQRKILEKQRKNYSNSLNALSQFLRLYAGEPIRIEAYDISNIHGVWATGSMIVFYGDKPSKNDYRRFKIKTVQGVNDVAMIKEVLKRRLKHAEWPYPDLMLIDGGRAQLSAALQIANRISRIANKSNRLAISDNRLAVVALAKRQEEIYTEYSEKSLKLSALPESLKLVFQAIRNEAHRFAIFYYRHLHRRNLSFRP